MDNNEKIYEGDGLMNDEFKQVSSDVIAVNGEYLTRVVSSESFGRKLFDEEAEYGTTFEDIEIGLKEKGSFTRGILITLSRENEEFGKEELPETSYIDIIISDLLGTFISDWY